MTQDDRALLEFVLIAIPAATILVSLVLGVRQVRFLRELTGDSSLFTSILGLTWGPPPPPNPKYLPRQQRGKLFRRQS